MQMSLTIQTDFFIVQNNKKYVCIIVLGKQIYYTRTEGNSIIFINSSTIIKQRLVTIVVDGVNY